MIRLLVLVTALVVGCASMSDVERGYVNHPAMELKNRLTPASQSVLTNLNAVSQSSAGVACATCAH
ncbi:MAG: hypothetical protein SGI74_11745 [Oligoflexia bacterium]|nr:hypothetical protein [Oligoflexia bacterium]